MRILVAAWAGTAAIARAHNTRNRCMSGIKAVLCVDLWQKEQPVTVLQRAAPSPNRVSIVRRLERRRNFSKKNGLGKDGRRLVMTLA